MMWVSKRPTASRFDHDADAPRRLAVRHARSARSQGGRRLPQDIRHMAQERIALRRFHTRSLRRCEQDGISSRGCQVRRYHLNWLWSVKPNLLHFKFSVRRLIAAASAYEDVEWINRLVMYTSNLAQAKPEVKLFGTSDREFIGRSNFR